VTRRSLPLWLSPLLFMLLALSPLLLARLSFAAQPEDGLPAGAIAQVQAQLAAEALGPPVVAAPGVPDLSLEQLGQMLVQAISGRSWGLLAALGVVGLVFALRKLATAVGGRFAWFASPKGSVLISVVAGTATMLALALSQGQALTLGLLVSCLLAAASASGLWSWGQTVTRRGMGPEKICTPQEVANGECK
jgi:hypothetical protein